METSIDADPNKNYDILANVLAHAKLKHLPKKTQMFNKLKHKKEKWMTDELLKLVVRKNKLNRDWKSTSDEAEYERKRILFRTFDNIVERRKQEIKNNYYFDTFQAQKHDLKQSWGTLNEVLQ